MTGTTESTDLDGRDLRPLAPGSAGGADPGGAGRHARATLPAEPGANGSEGSARPTFAFRAGVSTLVGVWFVLLYGGAEAIAARRSHVPSFHFGWERHVPFVPAMIVPYLSIDLFFLTVPLVLATRRAVWVTAWRMMAAIAAASACFVLMPLRFAFDRPTTTGPLGWAIDWFHRGDLPLNQLPSLHVALLLIVGTPFVRWARGWMRAALLGWFGLIAASPLLVYQHHATDLLAGLGLGLACLTLIGDEPREPFGRNGRVGLIYLGGGLALTLACVAIGRWSWPLWWPAASLLAVAATYAVAGPAAYGKGDGRVSAAARLLFWPTLLGQHASRRWYARRGRAWDAVTPSLWIGRQLSGREAAAAVAAGVGAVIDLTCEFTAPPAWRAVPVLHLPTLDLTAPTRSQVERAVAFAAGQAAAGRVVYVHCKAGYSRTAVVAAAVLLSSGVATSAEQAIERLRQARPALVVRPEARRAIADWAANR